MRKYLIKLLDNRVRRNYTGGAGIDCLRGKYPIMDSDQPEDWICSTVYAKNTGLSEIINEGLSSTIIGEDVFLISHLFKSESEFYLGKNKELPFLCKLLDSSMRLHVQAHPTKDFARNFLGSEYGKLECYYILSIREEIEPYIRLGFQNPPSKESWKKIILNQDILSMDQCFENIPVAVGDVWYIPGGIPHAIGEGITMIEIMEPSDLVVRCEFERDGIIVPKAARFMGKDIDFCLNIFDYNQYSVDEVQEKFRLKPRVIKSTEHFVHEQLVPKSIADSFQVNKLCIKQDEMIINLSNSPLVGIVVKGIVCIHTENETIEVKVGESFFIAAAAKKIKFLGTQCEIVYVT
ncbi:hypothetical protein AwWohl_01930 [Gammaproteobacteria bacterium]|nr:hypothetical protein AwWohl_01930 [Gammaproteobacteria bacterium]